MTGINLSELFKDFSLAGLGKLSLVSLTNALIILVVCAAASKLLSALLRRAIGRSRIEKTLGGFLASAAKIVMWVVTFIIVAQSLGIPSASLLAILGAVGLALSLAVQGLVSNLFSGATMLLLKPFSSGDQVELAGITGTVEAVGPFHTRVITADNRRVYLPNKDVASSKIVNFAQESTRRVDISFFAAWGSCSETVKKTALNLACTDSRVLSDPAPFAGLEKLGEGQPQYILRAWTATDAYWDVYHSLAEGLLPALTAAGVGPANPQALRAALVPADHDGKKA